MGTLQVPKPHRIIDVPEAEYNTISGSLTITLDASCYSEYTITLSSGYANIFNATTNRKHLLTQRE